MPSGTLGFWVDPLEDGEDTVPGWLAGRSGTPGPGDARGHRPRGETMTTTWSLPETESRNVDSVLRELLERSQALAAHLVDRSGQLIASVGKSGYDLDSFASLAAADLSANDELARLIGEPHVDGVACIGSLRSMASTQVGEDLVLCVVFDKHSTLGLVRHRMRRASERLWAMFAHFRDAREAQPIGDETVLHFGVEAANALDDLLTEDTT